MVQLTLVRAAVIVLALLAGCGTDRSARARTYAASSDPAPGRI